MLEENNPFNKLNYNHFNANVNKFWFNILIFFYVQEQSKYVLSSWGKAWHVWCVTGHMTSCCEIVLSTFLLTKCPQDGSGDFLQTNQRHMIFK